MVQISYYARQQVKALSPVEKAELDRVLHDPAGAERSVVDGKFVSKFGQNMRVVWEKLDQGPVRVLAVVST